MENIDHDEITVSASVTPSVVRRSTRQIAAQSVTSLGTPLDPSNTSTSTRPECSLCQKTFSRWDTLRAHVRSAHGKSSICCPVCQKQFPTPYKLRRHELTHSYETPHQCSVCSKKFQRSDTLKHHELLHQKVDIECGDCSRKFSNKISYEKHLRTVTDKEYVHGEKAEVCKVCSPIVGASSHQIVYDDHVYAESDGVKLHQCTYCFKFFRDCDRFNHHYNTLCDRVKHARIHRKIPFPCPLCLKLYSDNRAAQRHRNDSCVFNPEATEEKKRWCEKRREELKCFYNRYAKKDSPM